MTSMVVPPSLSSAAKVLLPAFVYCLTDYCYSNYHYTRRFLYPIPAHFQVLSHVTLLVLLLIVKYSITRSVGLPRITGTSFLASSFAAVLLRYDVLDLNHNFGVPSFKTVTAVLLPLVLIIHGSDSRQCCGVFCAMLLSAFSGSHHFAVAQMVKGGILTCALYVALKFTKQYFTEARGESDDTYLELKTKLYLDIGINLVLGIILSSIVLIYFDSNTDTYSEFGVEGIILFAFFSVGKLLLLYQISDIGILTLMLSWVVKTLMFSMTYTLEYKFDLTISNLLAIVLWVIYLISMGTMRVNKSFEPKKCYTPLIIDHAD